MPTRNTTVPPRAALGATHASRIPLGTLPVAAPRERTDPLIRRLALDRLRDLRDDGVTAEYVGRMYGVTGDRILQLEDELRR